MCGGQDKEWMGFFLDDLRAFGINTDQWTTVLIHPREREGLRVLETMM